MSCHLMEQRDTYDKQTKDKYIDVICNSTYQLPDLNVKHSSTLVKERTSEDFQRNNLSLHRQ